MQQAEIRERIDSFPHWHYQFDLGGHLTPVHDKNLPNRHAQRRRHFFDPVVDLLGGSLEGRRVLDLGSNAGYWSLAAVEAGCDYVLGIEGRQMHVDQANFVFDAQGVDAARYDFVLDDVLDADVGGYGHFDVVLCLGILYHVGKPVELMERIAAVSSDVLVIDSSLSKAPGSVLELRWEDTEPTSYVHAVGRGLVMRPTKAAVCDLAEEFGYGVAVLAPDFRDEAGAPQWQGGADYRDGARRAFVCTKATDLAALAVETEPVARTDVAADRAAAGAPRTGGRRKDRARLRQAERLLTRTDTALSRTFASRTWTLASALARTARRVTRPGRPVPEHPLRRLQGPIRRFLAAGAGSRPGGGAQTGARSDLGSDVGH